MPHHLVVLDDPSNWAFDLPGAEVVDARSYLVDPHFAGLRRAKVYNLCRTYGYQTIGYYVSLLAAARGHHPLPSVTTLQDLRFTPVLRVVSDDLERTIQRSLGHIKGDRFQLSIYFGRNLAQRYDRLCQALFSHFPAPFVRAEFAFADKWRLESLKPIATGDIPDSHRDFVIERAARYFARPPTRKAREYRYDLAILVDPEEADAPSDSQALDRFSKAAESLGMRASLITKDEFGRIAEYDALFVRATTSVDHFTYRFARRAEAEGLVVIDDPASIIRCGNKVYQAELFERHDIACPKTVVVHRGNRDRIAEVLGLPVVLKRPDSSFSLGVVKAHSQDELAGYLREFFSRSELVVAQEYVPSGYDWRVGVLGARAIFVCKYFMAPGHWQIQRATGATTRSYGKVETMAVEDAPQRIVALAERTAGLIGDGFYGLDIKQVSGRNLVMEINDNPNVEGGVEDAIVGEELYRTIMRHFFERLERRGRNTAK
jgi:glutathione synthase/RimK-type ligase-like ATP-grasp enzyme